MGAKKKFNRKIILVIFIVICILCLNINFYNIDASFTEIEFTKIVTGSDFYIAIDTEGYLWSWGTNTYGQLGDGTKTSSSTPQKIISSTKFKDIECGNATAFAIDTSGNLWAWGRNTNGIFGNGTTTDSATPTKTVTSPKLQSISVHKGSSDVYLGAAALDTSGNIWIWGAPSSASVSEALTGSISYTPVKYTTGKVYKSVSIGPNHILAIDSSGNLYTAGKNNWGQLGNGSTEPLSESTTTLTNIKSGTTFSQVEAGYNFSTAVDTSGNLWIWGYNRSGYLGIGTSSSQLEPYKIKSGVSMVVALDDWIGYYVLDNNGDIWTCGMTDINGQIMARENAMDKDDTKLTKIVVDSNVKYIYGTKTILTMIDSNGITYAYDYAKYSSTTIAKQITEKTGYYVVSFYDYRGSQCKISSVASGTSAIAPTGIKTIGEIDGYIYEWGDVDFSNVTKNLTVNSIKTGITYYVQYNSNGGNGNMSNSTHTYGTAKNLTANTFTKSGYKFAGWAINSTDTAAKYTDKQSVNNLTTTNGGIVNLYAVWDIAQYTVTFINETEKVKTETVVLGESATAPELTKAGYTLSWDTDFSNVTSDLTVNAVWTANTNTAYKVEHYKQNTTLDGYDLFETEDLTGTTDTEVTAIAKTYEGFTENIEYEGRVASGNVAGDGSLVLKLYYDRNTYTITYEPNYSVPGGVMPPYALIGSFKYGESVEICQIDHTRTEYEFVNWNTKADGSGETYEVGDIYSENESITLYAQWESKEYTVTFMNETEAVKTETVDYGSSATAPELTKAGYTLSWDIDFSNVTSDLTVNAIWTANTNTPYKVEHYRRNLDNEVIGYDLFETEDLTGTTDTEVTAVAKTYEGFTENTEYTQRVASGNVAGDGSLVLKLYYDRNSYNITYELNGGTASGELRNSYTYGKELTLSNRVTKPGYVFVGWYDNVNLEGSTITRINAGEIGDKTFYAKWTSQEQFYITSEKHSINTEEKQITKVSPNTNVETFINNLSTNGTVKILNLNGDEVALNGLVGTGYKLQVEYKGTKYEYEIAVRGDLDGNGKTTITDLSILNQVLVKKLTLTGIREKAADIDYSEKTTITDLSMLNQAIVGKINL